MSNVLRFDPKNPADGYAVVAYHLLLAHEKKNPELTTGQKRDFFNNATAEAQRTLSGHKDLSIYQAMAVVDPKFKPATPVTSSITALSMERVEGALKSENATEGIIEGLTDERIFVEFNSPSGVQEKRLSIVSHDGNSVKLEVYVPGDFLKPQKTISVNVSDIRKHGFDPAPEKHNFKEVLPQSLTDFLLDKINNRG